MLLGLRRRFCLFACPHEIKALQTLTNHTTMRKESADISQPKMVLLAPFRQRAFLVAMVSWLMAITCTGQDRDQEHFRIEQLAPGVWAAIHLPGG